jgi:hypothetical protein
VAGGRAAGGYVAVRKGVLFVNKKNQKNFVCFLPLAWLLFVVW